MKNLNINIIICLLVAASTFGCSYEATAQKGEFGFRFMPTISSFEMKTSTGGVVKGEAKLGYGIGAMLGFNFSEHVGIQSEVIYSSITQELKEGEVSQKINLRYVNIPVLLSLNTGKSNPVNLNVVGGPQLGIGVGSKLTTTNEAGVNNAVAVLAVRKSDIGLAYGAGVDFGLNSEHTTRLGIGFRGVFGLVDISNNSNNDTSETYYVLDRTHLKTYSAYLGVSILF